MTETFSEALQRIGQEAYAKLDHGQHMPPSTIAEALQAHKASAYVQVSCCVMTDATGENHCTHPPAPRPSARVRLRWRIQGAWSRLRYRVGSWIAGVNFEDYDE